MARLTRQEQAALWIVLVLLAGGAAGRWWIHHGKAGTSATQAPASRSAEASPGSAGSGR